MQLRNRPIHKYPVYAIIGVTLLVGLTCSIGTGETVPTPTPIAETHLPELTAQVCLSPRHQSEDSESTETDNITELSAGEQAEFTKIGRRVAAIHELQFPADFGEQVQITRTDFRQQITEDLMDEDTIKELEIAEAVYKLLGLIPVTTDLRMVYENLYGGFVLGYYDSETEQFAVITDSGETVDIAGQEPTIAHEFVHLLQDCHFDLDALEPGEDVSTSDNQLALTAIIEGDARYMEDLYVSMYGSGSIFTNGFEDEVPGSPDPNLIPPIIAYVLGAPYRFGETFIREVARNQGLEGVSEAFSNPPRNTEQILFYQKYFANEQPLKITFASPFDSEWEERETDTFGPMFLYGWLIYGDGGNSFAASRAIKIAVEGWNGDYAVTYQNPQGEWAHAGIVAWDGSNDAAEFIREQERSLEKHPNFEPVSTKDSAITPAPNTSLSLWQGDAGVIGWLRFESPEYGRVAGYVISPTVAATIAALESLANVSLY